MRIPTSASTVAIACSLALFGGCAAAAAQTTRATLAQRVPTQLPTNARPIRYAIAATPDAAALSFDATVTIDIEVLEATDGITLNAADLSFGAVTLADAAGRTVQAMSTDIDAKKQIVTFRFADAMKPGRYRVTAAYRGKINTQAAGLFALDYESPEGRKRALYTQFEAPDARRFFPGWDEPNFRTPYDLTVTVPAGQTAVSNMPQAARVARADGSSVITFQTTPSMSSYLLFLGVGEFDRITTKVGETEIGVVTKKGDGEKGRFALRDPPRSCLITTSISGPRTRFPSWTTSRGRAAASSSARWRIGARSSRSKAFFWSIPRSPPRPPGSASSGSRRMRWRTSGSAISSRWRGGTTCG